MKLMPFAVCVWLLGTSSCLYAALPDIEAAVMNKDYTQVKRLASDVIKETRDSSERSQAQYYLGLAQLRLGDCTQARVSFQVVMDANPSPDIYDRAAIGLIEALYRDQSYKEALEAGKQLLKNSPRSSFLSLIYLKIAGCDLKLMHWEDASAALNKIINEFPQSPEAPLAKQLLEEKQYFAVQVGSFLDKARAISLIDSLKAMGQYAYVVETAASGGHKFYRVRVGQMSSLKEAEDLEKKLSQLGYPTLIYP